METKRKRDKLYGKRIAGMSFSEEDYGRIQVVCEKRGMSEAQVVRGSVAFGLGVYEMDDIDRRIQKAAEELHLKAYLVVRGAIREGLEEYLRLSRSRRRLEALRQLRDELGEEDRDLDEALSEYLERHTDVLEGMMEEEEFFQKTIDREDEQQDEEDRELQDDFDTVTGRRSDFPARPR